MAQSLIAETIVIHPNFPLASTIRDISDVNIREGTRPLTHPESPILFYIVEASNFQDFEAALEDDHTINDWDVRVDSIDCRIYRTHIDSQAKFITPKLANLGIHVLSKKNAERGWKFALQTPSKEILRRFWQYCREENVEFHLEKLYDAESPVTAVDRDSLKAQLTDRQLEVARTVTQMGYYKQEGASAEEVAAELDISPSTLSTHLRRIMAKVFHFMFEDV